MRVAVHREPASRRARGIGTRRISRRPTSRPPTACTRRLRPFQFPERIVPAAPVPGGSSAAIVNQPAHDRSHPATLKPVTTGMHLAQHVRDHRHHAGWPSSPCSPTWRTCSAAPSTWYPRKDCIGSSGIRSSRTPRSCMPREPRRDYLYLADIIDSARTVARWLAEHDGQWDDDEILRNAVLRQLSVIGEAASSPSAGGPRDCCELHHRRDRS